MEARFPSGRGSCGSSNRQSAAARTPQGSLSQATPTSFQRRRNATAPPPPNQSHRRPPANPQGSPWPSQRSPPPKAVFQLHRMAIQATRNQLTIFSGGNLRGIGVRRIRLAGTATENKTPRARWPFFSQREVWHANPFVVCLRILQERRQHPLGQFPLRLAKRQLARCGRLFFQRVAGGAI